MSMVVLAPLHQITGEHDPSSQGASPEGRHGTNRSRGCRIVVGVLMGIAPVLQICRMLRQADAATPPL
jgi:hypothetical protein